jgi:uncharacterized protein
MKITRMVCAGALLLAGSAAAEDGSSSVQKTTISLGTATPGGGFPLYGDNFAAVMNDADPSFLIQPRNTTGSYENIRLLKSGQLDIALVAGELAYEAFKSAGQPPAIQTAIYSSPGMFVVRADSPYKTIRDLVGKPVAFGAKGSGLPVMSRFMLDGIGLKQDEDFQAIYLDRVADGPPMVLDGRVAALWGAGIGWPGFTTLAASPGGARFIAPDADEIARIKGKHTFLKAMTVPAGTYPNQTAPIDSLESWSFILARADLPDEVAYRLARTLHRAEAALCKELAQACETIAANTVAATPDAALIHPGVIKYFREIGVVK